jgi:hypothetical protein
VGSARFSSPKTRPLPANPREYRRFSHTWKSHRRDRTGWLGRQDSNLGNGGIKIPCSALPINGHSEKSAKFDPFPINRLDANSERGGGSARAFWRSLISPIATVAAFDMIVFLTAWHGPDCLGFLVITDAFVASCSARAVMASCWSDFRNVSLS